jgi:hypothetical protein
MTELRVPSLEDLKQMIEPSEIAYFDLSWALPIRAMKVCGIIWAVDSPDIMQALLRHSETLRAPHEKEFPIMRIQSAIIWCLTELDVLTSQNG